MTMDLLLVMMLLLVHPPNALSCRIPSVYGIRRSSFVHKVHSKRVGTRSTWSSTSTTRSTTRPLIILRKSSTTPQASTPTPDEYTTQNKVTSKQTALVWLCPNRLRINDNLALTKAVELGVDGLTLCTVWPYPNSFSSASSTSTTASAAKMIEITPAEAFGHAALHSFNATLGKKGQRIHVLSSISMIAKMVKELNPTTIVVDVSLLDRHCNHASRLRDKLHCTNENNDSDDDCDYTSRYTDAIPNIIEVLDDGLLIPMNKIPKALGRSRQGGRILRWSTFLINAMLPMENVEKPTWTLTSLPPPPLATTEGMEIMLPEQCIAPPQINNLSSWTRQLLFDWGEVSEDEAIRRAKSTKSNISSSLLTEEGSQNTKLSPYLRWGVLSPQRAAKCGVRRRDLLWRDWSHLCYGLVGPLRRGDAVLEYMNKACSDDTSDDKLNADNKDELFRLWCVGNTGYELVDAGMRQLWAEGWMSRKARLLAAACLVEGMGVSWQLGRDWFAYTLIDHDPAINEMMWQNAGLCGVDPFYYGLKWEVPPSGIEEVEYVERWIGNTQLVWPFYLKPYTTERSPFKTLEEVESQRNELRRRGIYKAARDVSNRGVRISWPGLATTEEIDDGEVMGVGNVAVHELSI